MDVLAALLAFDQAGLLQHPQVRGQGRLAEVEAGGDLADGQLAAVEVGEDPAARGGGQGLEDAIHGTRQLNS